MPTYEPTDDIDPAVLARVLSATSPAQRPTPGALRILTGLNNKTHLRYLRIVLDKKFVAFTSPGRTAQGRTTRTPGLVRTDIGSEALVRALKFIDIISARGPPDVAPAALRPTKRFLHDVDEFAWTSVPGAERYEIQVASRADMQNAVWAATDIFGLSWSPPAPAPVGNLYWRVRAANRLGWGPWSDPRMVVIAPRIRQAPRAGKGASEDHRSG